ncbi:MAG TPA: SRPBCC domain-containing protein [Thermoanaerobaculia bacterium]|nr:SRPBCC domain-containing protein [Thermoanaerobaculia bacterium]
MSGTPPPGDSARVSVFVDVPPAAAWDVFTKETDLWWRQGPRFRIAGMRRGALGFEPGPGGRLFETWGAPPDARTHTVGRILAWEPPSLLELEWRGVNFKPGESTRVTVRFVPRGDGTLVTVHHAGWSALPADHPARHGLQGAAFARMIGLWWGDLLTALREHAAERATGTGPGAPRPL